MTAVLITLLAGVGLLVLMLVADLLTDVSEVLSERVGLVAVRAVTAGRFPRQPLSPAARTLTAVVGVVTLGLALVAVLLLMALIP